jgi:hypothetical protein
VTLHPSSAALESEKDAAQPALNAHKISGVLRHIDAAMSPQASGAISEPPARLEAWPSGIP